MGLCKDPSRGIWHAGRSFAGHTRAPCKSSLYFLCRSLIPFPMADNDAFFPWLFVTPRNRMRARLEQLLHKRRQTTIIPRKTKHQTPPLWRWAVYSRASVSKLLGQPPTRRRPRNQSPRSATTAVRKLTRKSTRRRPRRKKHPLLTTRAPALFNHPDPTCLPLPLLIAVAHCCKEVRHHAGSQVDATDILTNADDLQPAALNTSRRRHSVNAGDLQPPNPSATPLPALGDLPEPAANTVSWPFALPHAFGTAP